MMNDKAKYILLLKHFFKATAQLPPLQNEGEDSFFMNPNEAVEELKLAEQHTEYKTAIYILASLLDSEGIADNTLPQAKRDTIKRGITAFGERALYTFTHQYNLQKGLYPDKFDADANIEALFTDYTAKLTNKITHTNVDDLV